jgi:predicted nucleic acid-binding Zn ribbon protein
MKSYKYITLWEVLMKNQKNYKNKHVLIVCLSIIIAVVTISPFNIYNSLVAIIQMVPIILFAGPYEKVDELVENNLNRANKIIMILLLILLMLFSLIENNNVNIVPNILSLTACIAIGIRSILFLWFDRNINLDKGE